MKDALGMEINLGCLYGYSRRTNGIVSVIIGRAEKFNKDSLTLEVVKRGRCLYNDPIKEDYDKGSRTVSVSSNSLFPLGESATHWSEQ